MSSQVVKKKVSPYPIETDGSVNGNAFKMNIVKLTVVGFLAEMTSPVLAVGQELEATFTLPVFKQAIQQPIKVIKTYDKWGFERSQEEASPNEAGAHQVEVKTTASIKRLVEFHFVQVDPDTKKAIQKFLVAIGQLEGRHA